jgi:glutamyl-tRNA reductase
VKLGRRALAGATRGSALEFPEKRTLNLQVVYCNHQTARLDVREKLAFAGRDQLHRAYERLRSIFPQSEWVLLSTCNRIEVYAAQEDPQDAPSQRAVAEFFSDFHHVPLEEFFDELLQRTGPDAVRHLFQVAASLDSMVLGEPQIVNQVKEAYSVARENDACGLLTNSLFQRALSVSARIRSETSLAEGRISIASVAVGEFAKSIFDHFGDKRVLIIGAGEMAEETLRYLKDEGVGEIVVTNRSPERARELAEEFGGTPQPYEQLDRWMSESDVIVSTTGADRPIVDAARFRKVREHAGGRPVFVLDLGAPRDFDSAVEDVDDGVFLYDIDSLEQTCERNRLTRAKEIERAMAIIDDETERFMHDVYHQATGPIIKRLREEWHDIRRQEVDSLLSKLSHVDDADRREIEKSIERIVNKLLHPPLKALRDEAREGTPHGLMDALRRLFHLHD